MTAGEILAKRECWIDETVNKLQKNLMRRPDTQSEDETYVHTDDKLVTIYGTPQIGKTTLILALMGIAPNYRSRLYKVLRGDVARGNSSTAAPIMYQNAGCDQYGMSYASEEKHFFDTEQEFKQALHKLRERVENGSAKRDILHIYIPQQFYLSDAEKHANINILDLPGDGSRNEREAQFAEPLIRQYVAIASVNIVACKANNMQSLEQLELPEQGDWRYSDQRNIIVLTSAYDQESIRRYFQIPPEQRKITFESFVMQQYHNEILEKDILPENSRMEIFPIDLGESLNSLIEPDSSKIIREEDRKLIRRTVESQLERIRQSIQKRRGNRFMAIIRDWRDELNRKQKTANEEIKVQIEDGLQKLAEAKCQYDRLKVIHDDFKAETEKYEGPYAKYCSLDDLLRRNELNMDKIPARDHIDAVCNKVNTVAEYKDRINDRNSEVVRCFDEQMREYMMRCLRADQVVQAENWTEKETKIEKYAQNLYYEMDKEHGFTYNVRHSAEKNGLFGRKPLVSSCLAQIEESAALVQRLLRAHIISTKEQQKDELEQDCKPYLKWKYETACTKNQIVQNNILIDKLRKRFESAEDDLREIQRDIDSQKKCLNDYMVVAHEIYEKYHQQYEQELRSMKYTVEERLMWTFLLGLMEKDFKELEATGGVS